MVVNGVQITSKQSINVLGVEFDCKIQWGVHMSNAIKKAKKYLHAIRLIIIFFNKEELKQLIPSNFYSVLYYNSEIWHIPTLSRVLEGFIISASAAALKLCTPSYNYLMSFERLHLRVRFFGSTDGDHFIYF